MLHKATPDRLSAFSDAVFAVLITVLVLELRPPEQPTFEALLLLSPTWLSYAVSYVFIAIVWVSVLSTERGLHLTFSSGDTEESIELSPEAVEQTSKTLHGVTRDAGEGPLTLTVLGHQVVRTHEAYGLLLRTQEFGEVVFSLPHVILKRLIGDLMSWHHRHRRLKHLVPGTRPDMHVATWESVAPKAISASPPASGPGAV